MAKAFDSWQPLEHGPLNKPCDNLWHVSGAIPGMALRRRMTVAKMGDGRLVVHNPVALGDSEMAEIEEWGTPAFIVTPNAFHRLDTPNFKRRYPDAKVLCPPAARAKVEQVAPVDGSYADFPSDDSVRLDLLDGVNGAEGVMTVTSGDRVSLVFNDCVFNIPHGKGVAGLIFRVIGSSGGPKVTRIAKTFLVKDKRALKAHLERLASTPNLDRIIPGHGRVIESDAGATLRLVASGL